MKIRILKDHAAGKVGEVVEASFPAGNEQEFVDNGFIEIIKEEPALTAKQIIKELTKAVELGPLQQEGIIDDLVNRSHNKRGAIKKQMALIKKETKDKKSEVNKMLFDEVMDSDSVSIREKVLSLMQRKDFGEATEVLVKKIEADNYIYTTKVDKASEVYIYKKGIYLPEGEFEIKEQLRIIMTDNYSEWIASQVMAKIKTDTGISPDKFFEEENLYELPVLNGILDLKTRKLEPFDPKKIFFSKMPVTYDPMAKCELIDKFLTEILSNPDDKKVFYELTGFGLCKEYFMERAFMFVGNGRNGKSKSIELLKRLVGVGNTASVPLSAITSDSPFVERLWKRYFNLAGDISSKDLKETGMFKQLTGRDPISANRKYKNVVEFTNYAKLVFACNELPRVYDFTDGFWDRWVLLEFPYKFVEKAAFDDAKEKDRVKWKIKDQNIIEKITTKEEMSGFLNKAIDGLQRCINNKMFSYTIGTEEVKNTWIRRADSFSAFCMDMLEGDYASNITKRVLRNSYKQYCNLHKVSGASDKAIKATLQEMFGVSEDRISVGLEREFVWTGVKFQEKKEKKIELNTGTLGDFE